MRTRDATKEREGEEGCCTLRLRIKPGRRRLRQERWWKRAGGGGGEAGWLQERDGGACYYAPLWMVTSSQRKGNSVGCRYIAIPGKPWRPCLVNNNRGHYVHRRAGTNCRGYITPGACSGIDLSGYAPCRGQFDYRYSIDTVYLSVPVHDADVIAEVSADVDRLFFSVRERERESRPKNINWTERFDPIAGVLKYYLKIFLDI